MFSSTQEHILEFKDVTDDFPDRAADMPKVA